MDSLCGDTSILSDHPMREGEPAEPAFFSDLNLDQVFTAVADGRDEYDLTPFFRTPLRDAAAVTYRHDVFRDLERQAVATAVAEFGRRMRTVREYLAQARKLRYRYQKEFWFLDAVREYREAVSALAGALGEADLAARGFIALRDYLSGYAGSAAFATLTTDIERVSGALARLRYCVNIKGEPGHGLPVRG